MVPLVFSRLDTLDLSHINTDDLGTEELGGFGNLLQRISDTLVNTFPFQGIRRKIILPEIDQEYFSDLGPEELPYISNKEWQLWVEEINTKPNQYIDDKWLERFTGLISCKKLKIDNGMIGDEGLGHIGKLKMLGELELPVSRGNKITTGIGVARLLKDCELLEHYCDVNAVIDGAHLSKLTQPLRMKSLFIDHLDDSGLRVICDICPELEEFMLGGRRITPGALEKLQKLKKLRYLNVEGCDWLDDRSIIEIGKLEALEELHIGSDIDDRGVITDEDLERLGNLSNLKKLSLYGCDGMTRAGLSAFKQKLPNCVIYGEESIVFED